MTAADGPRRRVWVAPAALAVGLVIVAVVVFAVAMRYATSPPDAKAAAAAACDAYVDGGMAVEKVLDESEQAAAAEKQGIYELELNGPTEEQYAVYGTIAPAGVTQPVHCIVTFDAGGLPTVAAVVPAE